MGECSCGSGVSGMNSGPKLCFSYKFTLSAWLTSSSITRHHKCATRSDSASGCLRSNRRSQSKFSSTSLCTYTSANTYVEYPQHRRFDIIPILVDVAQGAAKEKVIRVIVATFRVRVTFRGFLSHSLMPDQNLISKAPQANLPAMLVARLLPFAKNLSTRKWTDEDIPEDIQFIRDELSTRFESLTCVHT